MAAFDSSDDKLISLTPDREVDVRTTFGVAPTASKALTTLPRLQSPLSMTAMVGILKNNRSYGSYKTYGTYILPLVDGNWPAVRGSICVAASRARERPLKIASAT